MNKQIPSINKIIKFGQLKRNYELHQSKVKNAKSTLTTRIVAQNKTNYTPTNRIPRVPFGNSFNRMIDIEFQNKALLKKLTQKNKFNINTNRPNPKRNGQSNCRINRNINKKKFFQEYQLLRQNQGLLKRLKQTKPLYKMQKYVSQRKITEQYINSISKFGYKGLKPTKTIVKFEMVNNLAKYYDKSKQLQQQQEYQRITRSNSNQVSPVKPKTKEKQRQKQYKLSENMHKTNKMDGQKNKQNLGNSKISKIINKKPVVSQQSKRVHRNSQQKQNIMTLRISNNNSSLLRTGSQQKNRSHSNSPQSSSNIAITIPQKAIRINGKKFILKGKQYHNKVSLQILNCKNKQIGHDYIHEVQIDSAIYMKRFQGRIDVLIEHLRFDKENQGFYIQ